VNKIDFLNIAKQEQIMDSSMAIEMQEISKEFPFFSWPFAILSRHQNVTEDFRAENTLHQAAIRIHDREWLSVYVSDLSRNQENPHLKVISNNNKIDEAKLTKQSDNEIIKEGKEFSNAENKDNKNIDSLENQTETITTKAVKRTNSKSENTHSEEIRSESTEKNLIAEKESNTQFFTPIIEPKEEIKTEIPRTSTYNIEDYFENIREEEAEAHKTEKLISRASKGFYDWLNSDNQVDNRPVERKEDLIEKFLKTKPSINRPKQEFFSPEKAMKKSEVLGGGLATETLAKIYYKQGNLEKAISVYQQLQLKFPEKSSYFADLIKNIQNEIE